MSLVIAPTDVIAVVGASNSPEKFGHKIVATLKAAGYTVRPINPFEKTILGLPVYHRLADVPGRIDLADMVVPPAVTLKVLEEVHALGLKKVWFQPGSESDEALEYCRQHEIEFVAHACLMETVRL